MKRFFVFFIILLFGFLILCRSDATPVKSREFEFDYKIVIKDIPSNAIELKVWIPYLPQRPYQAVKSATIDLENFATITEEEKFKNKILYYDFKTPKETSLNINVH